MFVGDSRTALLVMFAAVGVLLLIATVNVANLLLVRAASRGREMAVRLSLGAGRSRLIRQLLTESVLLSLAGAAGGIALAYFGLEVLRTTNAGTIPRIEDVRLDTRVLLFTALVSMAAGVLFGLVPALQSARSNLTQSLRDGARGTTGGVARRRMHAALVAAEISLSLMLLIGAGLLLRSFFLLQHVRGGVPGAGVAARDDAGVAGSRAADASAGQHVRRGSHGARTTSSCWNACVRCRASTPRPPRKRCRRSAMTWSDSFVIEGQERRGSAEQSRGRHSDGQPRLLPRARHSAAARPRLQRTRHGGFDAGDGDQRGDGAPVFRGRDPIGRRIKISGPGLPNNPRYEVIGVVGNVKYTGLQEERRARLLSDDSRKPRTCAPTSSCDRRRARGIAQAVRREIQALDPAAVVNR